MFPAREAGSHKKWGLIALTVIALVVLTGVIVNAQRAAPKLGQVTTPLTDYKFWYIKRDDNGFITEAAVRFYEGDYDGKGRYIRSQRLNPSDLGHLSTTKSAIESSKKTAIVYLPSDFGKIQKDEELQGFLNQELAKDSTRKPIPEQRTKGNT